MSKLDEFLESVKHISTEEVIEKETPPFILPGIWHQLSNNTEYKYIDLRLEMITDAIKLFERGKVK